MYGILKKRARKRKTVKMGKEVENAKHLCCYIADVFVVNSILYG